MGFIIEGTIVQALPIQSGVGQKTGNQWSLASYVIEHESGQYPKRMVFDVRNQKIQELNIQVGDKLKAYMNCDIREYNGRIYNSIDCWKVERADQQQAVPQGQYQQPQYQQAPVQPQYQQMPPQQPAPGAAPFPPQQPQAQAPQGQPQGKLPF